MLPLMQGQLNTEWTKAKLCKQGPYVDGNTHFGETVRAIIPERSLEQENNLNTKY
jgi:hypothetical protein